MNYYDTTKQEVFENLRTSENGLSSQDALARLEQYGPNEISVKGEPLWSVIIEPFRSVFVYVLLAAAGISLYQREFLDAGVVVGIVLISAVIYYVQRYSTERILRNLRHTDPQKISVMRDGTYHTVDASELVPGDYIHIEEGDKIPADAYVVSAASFRVDESQLTGESVPITKTPGIKKAETPLYERTNMVYQGSFTIGGNAEVVIVATGNATEFGRIAELSAHQETASPVQQKIDRLVTQVITGVIALSAVTFILALLRGIAFTEALRFVMALAVSAVPEGLPVAIAIVLAIGMKRMAARKALVRSMSAIESVGIITTVATDKTGTLTTNKLSVSRLWHPDGDESAALTALKRSMLAPSSASHVQDPLDTAFSEYASHQNSAPRREAVKSYQFETELAMSGNAWHNGESYIVAVKGAPESILEHSHLTDTEREQALLQLQSMAGEGLRVIALAHASAKTCPNTLKDISSSRLEFDGLVAVGDTLRKEAHAAIAAARRAGITVRMVTGDHVETAYQIGRTLGLVSTRDQVLDCRTLDALTDDKLAEIVEHITVFARVIPEQKHRLLTVLKKHNITAMTGDGVNDVPALTNAHIGLAMGSGTQIAKDAGDIILLDDNFRSIIAAVREGRTIFANIKRMVTYLLATNLGEVLTATGALLAGMPLPLTPIQLLWVNLTTDTPLVIPLGLEPGDKAVMKRPPQPAHAPLLDRFMVSRIILVAFAIAAVTLGVFIYFTDHGLGYDQTMAFCALAIMQWGSALSMRSDYEPIWQTLRRRNPSMYIGLAIAILLQIAAIFTPLSQVLSMTPLDYKELLVVGVIAFITPIIVIELHKYAGRHWLKRA